MGYQQAAGMKFIQRTKVLGEDFILFPAVTCCMILSHLVNSLWYFFWCTCIMFSYRHGFTFDPTCISSKWSQAEAILPCTCVLHVSPVHTHYILWWKHLDHQQVDGVFNNCTKPCLTLNGVSTALFQVNIPFITRGESANFSLVPSLRLSLGSFIDIS